MNTASCPTRALSLHRAERAAVHAPLRVAARLGLAAAAVVLTLGLASAPAGSNENGASAFDILPDAPARLLIEGRYADDIPFRISPVEPFVVTAPRQAAGMDGRIPSH